VQYDIAIVGNGIMGKCLKHKLSKLNKKISVLQLSSDSMAPACSHRSTGIVSLNGIRPNISPLGDLLRESYKKAIEFFESENPYGVTKAKHYFLVNPELDKSHGLLERRFGDQISEIIIEEIDSLQTHQGVVTDCYHVDHEKFMPWMEAECSFVGLEKRDAFVVDLLDDNEGKTILTQEGSKFSALKVFLCTGAHAIPMSHLSGEHDNLLKTKQVPGNYAIWNKKLALNSFTISSDNSTFTYRKADQCIMIGGTTNADGSIAINGVELEEQYDVFKKILGDKLPKLSEATIRTGIRHKGHQRNPWWGEVSEGIFGFHGLYKNGWTLPFHIKEDFFN
jgi:glycine/D-amino acid oxidase-like deaminating enzyme